MSNTKVTDVSNNTKGSENDDVVVCLGVRKKEAQTFCIGCGNKTKRCHDELFGEMLVHDAMTMCHELENSGCPMHATKMRIWNKFEEN